MVVCNPFARNVSADGLDEEPIDYQAGLIDFLLDLYYRGEMDAKKFCSICWYLSNAGWTEADAFGMAPTSQSGKFQDCLDRALSFSKNNNKWYPVEIPTRDDRTGQREPSTILFNPVHEALAEEVRSKPAMMDSFAARISTSEWLPIYENNVIVRSCTREQRKTSQRLMSRT